MISRRSLITSTPIALAAVSTGRAGTPNLQGSLTEPKAKAVPDPNNPFAARIYIFTIVTPDIEASIRFYRDVMGNELIDSGTLADPMPTISGIGAVGRRYALLRHREFQVMEHGVVRLLEAPAGAKENRPRPQSRIVDPGLAIMECHPSDWETAFQNMAKHGVETVSVPLYYFYGAAEAPKSYSITFSAFGPAGEQLFISSWPPLKKNYAGLYGPFVSSTVMCWDRWPVFDFYQQAFALGPTGDVYVGEETENFRSVNLLTGAPPGSYFQFGGMGQDFVMEWWEYRQWKPSPTPPWPTDLDRTGLAMRTVLVDDLDKIRTRVTDAKIPLLGEGALPSPEVKSGKGFYIRGAVGELFEVIGRG